MNENNNEQTNNIETTNESVNTQEQQSVNQNIVEPQANTEPQTVVESVQPQIVDQPNVGAVSTVQQPMNNNVTPEVPKKKSNKALIIILILLVLVILVGIVYYLMKNNSNEITSDNEITTTKTVVEETTTKTEKVEYIALPSNWVLTTDENSNGIAGTGDLITLGTESFYVISNTSEGITALAQYNLYVGGKACLVANEEEMSIETELVSSYSSEEATGLQSELMQNSSSHMSDFTEGDCWEGITIFSNETFEEGADFTTYYNNSTIKKYLDNYKSELVNLGADSIEVRLIKEEELTELGCTKSKTDVGNCELAPSWVYGNTNYWTMSYEADTLENFIIIVDGDGYWKVQPYVYYYPSNVRPVVVIS